MTTHKIALIPGDGIGTAVTESAVAVARAAGAVLETTTFPWSCDHYLQTGKMMPEDGIETLRGFDAIFLGAVGWPAKVPDSVSLHGLLLPIRKAFVQYANIRPHRLLPGVEGPLKTRDFDILCIRENTEGEYSGAGGRVHVGTPDEVAVETSIFTARAWNGSSASASSRRCDGGGSWPRSRNPMRRNIPWCSGTRSPTGWLPNIRRSR